jgi:hypothetical protein
MEAFTNAVLGAFSTASLQAKEVFCNLLFDIPSKIEDSIIRKMRRKRKNM